MIALFDVAIALIGFSVCSALLLFVALFSVYRSPEQTGLSRLAGSLLLLGMAVLQILHYEYLAHGGVLFESKLYAALLFVVAPAFYLFFRAHLEPREGSHISRLLFFVPVAAVPFLDNRVLIPLSFLMGVSYAVSLALLVWRLRAQRKRFRLELVAFAAFAVVALLILVLGLIAPLFGLRFFVFGYSILTGLAFWLVVFVLLRFPEIVAITSEAVLATYAASTLKSVNCDDAIARLKRLFEVDKIYADEDLSLARLAELLQLTPHQLSELINTHCGVGFSRYVREHRVAAAKRMLVEEPRASVLSVGLSVGFTSQSNFYTAFREITGEVPGKFRKQRGPVRVPQAK
jgi:AraC-like DNA-binding protein